MQCTWDYSVEICVVKGAFKAHLNPKRGSKHARRFASLIACLNAVIKALSISQSDDTNQLVSYFIIIKIKFIVHTCYSCLYVLVLD